MANCPHCDEPLTQVYRFTRDMDRYGVEQVESRTTLYFEKTIDSEALDDKWYCYECGEEVGETLGDYEYA